MNASMPLEAADAPRVPWRVGAVLTLVQFFFALSWVVYLIYLPALAVQVGIPRQSVAMLLLVDQTLFVVTDYAFGVLADRMARLNARLAPMMLAVTVLSGSAFLLLPWVAPAGSATLFLALMVLWSLSASVLRAPPMNLIGRYTTAPRRPALVALSMLGLGLASAAAPYLGLALASVDPRWPFALSSGALVFSTVGLVVAERLWQRQPSAPAAAPEPETKPSALREAGRGGIALHALAVALLLALGFQTHVFVNSASLYLRWASPAELPWLMPAFWVAFNLGLWPASWAHARWGAMRVVLATSAAAAVGAGLAMASGALAALLLAQMLTGCAWAAVLTGAYTAALALGQRGQQGRATGALSSVLALAALSRIALTSSGILTAAAPNSALGLAVKLGPVLLWAAAALLVWISMRRRA